MITVVPIKEYVTQTSASQEDKKAQVALDDMYKDGKGVPQDYQATSGLISQGCRPRLIQSLSSKRDS